MVCSFVNSDSSPNYDNLPTRRFANPTVRHLNSFVKNNFFYFKIILKEIIWLLVWENANTV